MTPSEQIETLQRRIVDLEAALKQNDASLAVTFRLTPSLSDVFGLLTSLPVVTSEVIQKELGLYTDPKVAICRLRKHLEPWDIQIMSRRHIGYWLEQEDKDRINELVTNLGGSEEQGSVV